MDTHLKKVRAIIVDDEQRGVEVLQNLLNKYCPEIEVVSTHNTIETAYQSILKSQPDIVFLDIDIPPDTGFDLLKRFDKLPFEVIFVTAFDHYAIEAIKFSALYYILKPIKIQELKDSIVKVKQVLSTQPNFSFKIKDDSGEIRRIVLKSQRGIDLVELDHIIYLKAENVYTRFFMQPTGNILISKPIKEYEAMLRDKGFFRIHKSYMVNLKHVVHYNSSDSLISLSNQDRVPLSINQREEFLNRLQ